MEAEGRSEPVWIWFQEHGEFLACWLRARLGPTIRRDFDVADLLQEIWVRALRAERHEQVANPRGWLLGFARNIVYEVLRHSARGIGAKSWSIDGTGLEIPDTVTSFTRRIARAELRQSFFAALDELANDDRQLVLLHGLEGRPMSEIAPRLGLSVDAAHKRWQRLRDRLRSLGSPADLI
ncbi:MAG: RNA polymerase sigma factor [Planctomycetes bacterium]|nr:RNA polymerase sigma factor [Planctomycetota bacterium]